MCCNVRISSKTLVVQDPHESSGDKMAAIRKEVAMDYPKLVCVLFDRLFTLHD